MAYAVIDLGSNTIRLSILELQDQQIKTLFQEKEVVGLAGYVQNDCLDAEGIVKTCDALNRLQWLALKFVDACDIHVFATAVFRMIANQEETLAAILRETALRPKIITGEEEALLDFIGARRQLQRDKGMLIDIGGASTELVYFSDGAPRRMTSLPIGCLSLHARFVKDVCVSESEMPRIRKEIRHRFDGFPWTELPPGQTLIGIGGTARTALKLSRAFFSNEATADERETDAFPAIHVSRIRRMLEKRKPGAYQTVYKIAPERVLTIATGLLILEEAVRRLGCRVICVSKTGVREGYFLQYIQPIH